MEFFHEHILSAMEDTVVFTPAKLQWTMRILARLCEHDGTWLSEGVGWATFCFPRWHCVPRLTSSVDVKMTVLEKEAVMLTPIKGALVLEEEDTVQNILAFFTELLRPQCTAITAACNGCYDGLSVQRLLFIHTTHKSGSERMDDEKSPFLQSIF